MKVRWTGPAASDLEDIVNYIARDHPSAAREVAMKLFDAGEGLKTFPRRGRLGLTTGTREQVVAGLPYILVYRVTDSAVEILRIFHGAQIAVRSTPAPAV